MEPTHQTSGVDPTEVSEADLASIVTTLLNHWKTIAFAAGLFIALGGLYVFLTPPIYQARLTVQIEENSEPSASASKSVLDDVSSMFNVKSSAEGEIQILGSKLIVSRAVDALKLYISAKPHHFPLIGNWIARHNDGLSRPGLFGRGGYAWGDELIDVATFEVPKQLEGAEYRVTALSRDQYQFSGPGLDRPVKGQIGVKERFGTSRGFITLLVSKINGESGVVFDLTRHSRQLTVDNLQKRLQIAEQGNKSNVLSASLESTDPVLVSATINEIGKQYVQQNAERKAVNAENSLRFLESQLTTTRRQMEEAEDRYNAYRNSHALLDTSEESKLMLKQSAEAEAYLFDLTRKRQEITSHFSGTHPNLAAIDEQIATTERYRSDLAARIKEMPMAEQGALRLMRDVRVSTDLYGALRNNIELLRLIKAGKGSVQLVDSAEVPERPVKPMKALVLAVSAVLGLFVGVGLAFARDFLFKGITDPRELESRTGLSVYATIPLSERQLQMTREIAAKTPERLVLSYRCPNDPVVESLRMLRTALQFALLEARNNVVLLAGPLTGIGKSFLAANLATVLAAGGQRVLLVDGDLRKGHLNQYFGLTGGPGLADVLAGSLSLNAAVHKEILPNLDVLQAGRYPPNPAELLLRSNVREVILEASLKYDIVLLDAAAILAVSDACIMAPSAGLIFLIARFADTRVEEITESVKRLAQSGSRVNGVLLNGFRLHGGSYAYTRRYGNYVHAAYDYESCSK
jgi:tyrosine-protein kinase Etk/Wzc